MWKITKNVFFTILAFCILDLQSIAEEKKNETELNVYTGMFDFSDDKQRSPVLGIEHQNDELFIRSSRGFIYSPITGGFITGNNAFYLYTGIQAEYNIGNFIICIFTPFFILSSIFKCNFSSRSIS